ncbi:MAG: rhomboid family intramembrane serine protease, partial [Myxococcales bacterium]|nr:rhomboid family intramembrane serine protease [Myxococcales bacterium]
MTDRPSRRRRLPRDVRQALRRPARTTVWLVASLVGVFLLQLKVDALTSVLAMIRLGANVPPLVWAGEWWRLVSANFLHGSALHIAFNGWALWVLGGLLERMLDGRRLLLLYLVSALGGALASTLFSGALLAVGASTAVFGLLGGLAAVQWRLGPAMPDVFRQSRRWWWLVLGINGAISFLVPNVDAAAHVGGFAAGGLLGLVLVGPRRPLMARTDHPGVLGALFAMLAVFGFGLGQAYLGAVGFDDGASARALRAVAAHDEAPPEVLNELAWTLALDKRAGRQTLEAAAQTAQVAVDRAEAEGSPSDHVRDTLATVQSRLGEPQAAGATELGALVEAPRPFYATQLGRFLVGAPKPAWLEGAPQARPGGQR